MAERHIFVCDICAATQEAESIDEWYRRVWKWQLPETTVCKDCFDEFHGIVKRRRGNGEKGGE